MIYFDLVSFSLAYNNTPTILFSKLVKFFFSVSTPDPCALPAAHFLCRALTAPIRAQYRRVSRHVVGMILHGRPPLPLPLSSSSSWTGHSTASAHENEDASGSRLALPAPAGGSVSVHVRNPLSPPSSSTPTPARHSNGGAAAFDVARAMGIVSAAGTAGAVVGQSGSATKPGKSPAERPASQQRRPKRNDKSDRGGDDDDKVESSESESGSESGSDDGSDDESRGDDEHEELDDDGNGDGDGDGRTKSRRFHQRPQFAAVGFALFPSSTAVQLSSASSFPSASASDASSSPASSFAPFALLRYAAAVRAFFFLECAELTTEFAARLFAQVRKSERGGE